MDQRQAVIKNADMSEDMQQDAVDIASQAISKYNIEKVRDASLYGVCCFDYKCIAVSIWVIVILTQYHFHLYAVFVCNLS